VGAAPMASPRPRAATVTAAIVVLALVAWIISTRIDIPFFHHGMRPQAQTAFLFENGFYAAEVDSLGLIGAIRPAGQIGNLVFEGYGFAFNEYYDPADGYYYPTHNTGNAEIQIRYERDSVVVIARGWVSRSGRRGDMAWTNTYTFFPNRQEFRVEVVRERSKTYPGGVKDNSICFILDASRVEKHRLIGVDGTCCSSSARGKTYRPLRFVADEIRGGASAEMVDGGGVGVRVTLLEYRSGPEEFRVIQGEGYSEIEFEWNDAVREGKVEEAVFLVEVLGTK